MDWILKCLGMYQRRSDAPFYGTVEVLPLPSQSPEVEFDSETLFPELPDPYLGCDLTPNSAPFFSNVEVPDPYLGYNLTPLPTECAQFFSNVEVADPPQFAELGFDYNIIHGFKLLLSNHVFNPTQLTLLALKIIMETNHKKIVGELEEAAVATHGKDLVAYELEAKEAIELLLDYGAYWTHSCSITFTEGSRLHDTIFTSDIRSRECPKNNESNTDYTEVMLFVNVDGQTNDKDISNCKQLKMFLYQIMEKIISVHVTCSSTRKHEEHPLNSHLIISESKYLECLELEV